MKSVNPSRNDITGNRADNPNFKTRHASEPTRYASLSAMAGDGAGNPFGDPDSFDFFPGEDFADEGQENVAQFNSRMDLVRDLPSTAKRRFTAR